MRKKTRGLLKNKLLMGSLVMVVGSNIYNLGQFVYHAIAGRFLGKALYGDFATVISILGFVGIIQLSLGLTIVRFVAKAKTRKEIKNFTKWVYRWSVATGIIISVLLLLFSSFMVDFLKFSDIRAFYLLIIVIFFFFVILSLRSVLHGLLEFNKYVFTLLSESIVKIVLTAVFVIAGFALFGAVLGLLIGVVVSFVVTRYYLRDLLSGARGVRPDIVPLLAFSFPVFVQGIALTSMYTTDFLLVKHFFSPETASLYASLAILGRVVFFGTSPITQVMFPIITRKYSHGEAYHKILYLSILMVVGFAFMVTLVYTLLPSLPILALYGSQYIDGAPYLWWFGLFMGLLGLASLLTQFYLSIGKTRIVTFFLAAALLQAVLIWLNHTDIVKVVQMSVIAASALVIALGLYFPYRHEKK